MRHSKPVALLSLFTRVCWLFCLVFQRMKVIPYGRGLKLETRALATSSTGFSDGKVRTRDAMLGQDALLKVYRQIASNVYDEKEMPETSGNYLRS